MPQAAHARRIITELLPTLFLAVGASAATGSAPAEAIPLPDSAVLLAREIAAISSAHPSSASALAPVKREVDALAASVTAAMKSVDGAGTGAGAGAGAAAVEEEAPTGPGSTGVVYTGKAVAAKAAWDSGRTLTYDEEFELAAAACAAAGGAQTAEGFTTASGIMFAGFLFPKEGLPMPPDKPIPPPPPAPAPKHAVTPSPDDGSDGMPLGGAGAGAGAGEAKALVSKTRAAGGAGASAMSEEASSRTGTLYGKEGAGFVSVLSAMAGAGSKRFGKAHDKINGGIEVNTVGKSKSKNGPSSLMLYDVDMPAMRATRVEIVVTKDMKEADVAREVAAAIALPGVPHDDVWVYANFATAISHSDAHRPTVFTPAEFAAKAATQGKGDEVRVYLRRRLGPTAANDSVTVLAPIHIAATFAPGARIDPEAPPALRKQVTDMMDGKMATVCLSDATSLGMVIEQLTHNNFSLPKSERDYAVVLSKESDGDAGAADEATREVILRAGDTVDIKALTTKFTSDHRLTLVEETAAAGLAVTIKTFTGESRVFYVRDASVTGAQLKALIAGPTRLAPENMVLKVGDEDLADTTSLEDVDYVEGGDIIQAKKA